MIAVVGDILLDVVVTPDGPTAAGSDTPSTITSRQGGSAASTAGWIARLGAPVRLIGAVGNDGPGAAVTAELTANGVQCRIAVKAGVPTGTVVAVVTSTSGAVDRDMYTSRGASGVLEPGDFATGWLDGVTHLHISGYTLLHEESRSAGLAALGQARAASVSVSIDPASTAPLAEAGVEQFLAWIGAGVLLTPNLEEGRLLTGRHAAEEVARALGRRTGEAVVTCGDQGAVWSDGVDVVSQAGNDVADANPVGAGDAFSAGFLAARQQGADLRTQLEMGLQTAEMALRRT